MSPLLLIGVLLALVNEFQHASSMVLLTPPASHYGLYDEMRSDMFDFYAAFYEAGASVGEKVIFVADKRPRAGGPGSFAELIARGVAEDHFFTSIQLDDIWVRDFFTTQMTNEIVARFHFAPAYLDDQTVRWIDTSAERLLRYWNFPGLTRFRDIVLDGGGIVFETSNAGYYFAVVTDRVLRDNPRLAGRNNVTGLGPAAACCPADPYGILDGDEYGKFSTEELAAGELALEKELGLSKVAIVPEEPEVPRLGHIDGIANWLAPGVLALSNYSDSSTYAMYESILIEKFGSDNIKVVPFPFAPSFDTWTDGFESAKGIYVNFLRTGSAIYIPIFGLPEEDEMALRIAKENGDRPVVGINATAISIMGGSVRCLSQHIWGANADAVLLKIAEAASPSVATTTAVSLFGTMAMMTFGSFASF